jgi:hypothetical protein
VEELLDQAVFEGVEGDEGETTAGREVVVGLLQEGLELVELAVDGDAQGLKGARGGMDAALTTPHHPRHALGEGDGVGERLILEQRPGHTAGVTFLAVVAQDPHQLCLVDRREQLGGRDAGGRVHPHVDGAGHAEREATLGLVELRRRDAEIGEHAIDLRQAALGQHPRQPREVGVHGLEAVAEACEALPGRRQGRRVAVEPDHAALGRLEEGLGVTTAAEGAVDEGLPRGRGQGRHRLVAQHGEVLEAHGPSLRGMPARRARVRCTESAKRSSQVFRSQISMWPSSTCTTHSFSSPARSLSIGGTRSRPCPSMSTSLAVDSIEWAKSSTSGENGSCSISGASTLAS